MKIFKRSLSVFLAALMLLSSISAFAAIGDGSRRTLTSSVRFFRDDGSGNLVETTKVMPGESITARVYLESDFVCASHNLIFLYSKNLLTIDTSKHTGDAPEVDSYDKTKRTGSFIYCEGALNASTQDMVDHDVLPASVFDDYGVINLLGNDGLSDYFKADQWVYQFHFKVKSDAPAGSAAKMFIPPETAMSSLKTGVTYYYTYCSRVEADAHVGDEYGLSIPAENSFKYEFEVENYVSPNLTTVATAQGDSAATIAADSVATYGTATQPSSYVTVGSDVNVNFAVTGDSTFASSKTLAFGTALSGNEATYTAPFGYSFNGWPVDTSSKTVDDAGNHQAVELVNGQTVTGTISPKTIAVTYYPPIAMTYGDADNVDEKWDGSGLTAAKKKKAQSNEATYGTAFGPDTGWGTITVVDDTLYYFKGWTAMTQAEIDTEEFTPSATDKIVDLTALTAANVGGESAFIDDAGTLSLYLAPVILAIPTVTYSVTYYQADGTTLIEAFDSLAEGDAIEVTATEPAAIADKVFADSWTYYKVGSDPAETYTGTTMPAYSLYAIPNYLNTYAVTYDANGGTGAPAATTKTQGVDYTVSTTAPTREGYTFAGWNTTADGVGGTAYAAGAIYSTDAALTLYAQWTPITYTVTYDANGGTGAPAIATKNYNVDLTLSASIPTRVGYTFTGWNTVANAEGGTAYASSAVYSGNADLTLYAQWAINQYTISFESNGGSAVTAIKQDYGTTVTAPTAPTKEGSGFGKWYSDSALTTEYTFSTMPAENITLYASWTINQYTITFDTDGGNTIAPITQDFGTAVTAPENPSKTGYTFANWDTTVPTTMPAANITIKALWTINQYTISFESNGGSTVTPITQDYNTAVTAPTAPTKEGNTFDKWYSDSALTTEYTFATMPAASITLYAGWTVNQYTITFDTDGGNTIAPITQDFGTAVTAPENPSKTGYTFASWDKTVPTTMPAENVTIKALWNINTHTITFSNTGDTTIEPISQAYGTTIPTIADPTKTGYTFDGWDTAIPTVMPDNDLTISAKWKINSYTVTYANTGDSTIADDTFEYNAAITAPTAPSKTGYTFNGWAYANAETAEVYTGTTMPAYALTATAQWIVNTHSVTFTLGDKAASGATWDDGTTADIVTTNVAYGTAITQPANPKWTGHTFTTYSPAVDATMPDNDVTYTAQWDSVSYTITYVVNGGTAVTPTTATVVYGDAIPTAPATTQTGYTLDKWTYANAEGTAYTGTTMPEYDLTATAQWNINQYTISFESNGGSAVTAISQDYNTAVTAPTAPTKEGSSFGKWYSDSALTTEYTFSTMPAENITLYAGWTVNQYTITFDTNGGSAVTAIKQDYGTTVNAPTAPTKVGYTFGKWYSDSALTTEYVFSTMPSQDITVYAGWTVNQYTITYANTGDSTIANATFDYDATITAPTAPTKTGYTFNGWVYTNTETAEAYTGTTMPAYALTATAQWVVNTHSVTFTLGDSAASGATWTDDTNADIVNTAVEFGTTIAQPTTPIYEGHTFAGWTPTGVTTMPDNDVTFTATWTANEYAVKYYSDETLYEPFTIVYGELIEMPGDPEKVGYDFGGWKFINVETGDEFTVEDGTTTMPAFELRADAIWNVQSFKIAYDVNGGSDVITPVSVKYGDALPLEPDTILYGYTLAWTYANTATAEAYTGTTMPAFNLTATAVWTANKNSATFTLGTGKTAGAKWNDGTTDDIVINDINYGETFTTPTAPTWVGHTFTAWSPIPSTMPNEAITFTATWSTNQYTTTYYSDGVQYDQFATDYGELVEIPGDPEKVGYTFDGWEFKNADTNEAFTVEDGTTTVPAFNLTATAKFTINAYTITYANTGDTTIPGAALDYGTALPTPPTPTKTGYTFQSWAYTGTVSSEPYSGNTMPAYDLTATALWAKNNYTVTYANTGDSTIADGTFAYEAAITPPTAPTWAGHTFTGWTYTNTDTAETYTGTTMPAFNLTATAVWDSVSYTITYVVNGGDPVTPTSADVVFEAAIPTPPTATRTGYSFDKWIYTNTETAEAYTGTTMPAYNLTATAQWNINSYTVTYANTGDSTIADGSFEYGATITDPTAPTKTGYSFQNWTYTGTESGVAYTDSTMPAYNLTATAVWAANEYTIHFIIDGAEDTTLAITAAYNSDITDKAPAAQTKTGYTFKGWYSDPACTTAMDVPTTMPVDGLLLYGKFDINSYTITYAETGDSAIAAASINYNAAITTPENPTKTGYTFDGWTYTDAEGTAYTGTTMPAYNLTATGNWTINEYTIHFIVDGTEDTALAIAQKYDTAVTAPATPTKTGYTFNGWYSDAEYTTAMNVPATMPENGATLYGKFDVNSYAVTYTNTGDSTIADGSFVYGTAITDPTAPTKTGYTFDGWTYADAEGTAYTGTTMPAYALTATAKWNANSYTVTYANTGDSTIADTGFEFGTEILAPTPAPTWAGHTFTGWTYTNTETAESYTGTAMPAFNLTATAVWDSATYTITYEVDGGTAVTPTTATVVFGAAIPTAPTTTKTGYTLSGWTYKNTATQEVYTGNTMPAYNLTATAQWAASSYIVTYANTGDSTIANATFEYGATITDPTAPTKAGYTFQSWTYADAEGTAYTDSTMPAYNLTATAIWVAKEYTIHFVIDGVEDTTLAITATYNSDITDKAPAAQTKTGYTFDGWYSDAAYTAPKTTVPTAMPENGATLYGKFDINSYAITYVVNGGSVVDPSSVDVVYGEEIPVAPTTTQTGYELTGWIYTDAEGTAYTGTTMPAYALTATAQWTVKQYTITFTNTGDTTIDPITKDYGASVTAPTDPVWAGREFLGWDQTVPANMPAEDMIITAKWLIEAYTIVFDSKGGSAVDSIVAPYDSDINAPEDPTMDGYTFAGWYSDEALTESYTVPATMPDLGDDGTIKTVYAKWDINSYTITFNTNGGSTVTPITQNYGTAITDPGVPTKDGYTFGGWYSDEALSVSYTVPTTMPNLGADGTELNVYAKWIPKQYTISFFVDGTEMTALAITADYNSSITGPTKPIKEGYTFEGWYSDAAYTTEAAVPATMPLNGTSLYGKFVANGTDYTVEIYYADTANDYGTTPDEIISKTGTVGNTVTYTPEAVAGFETDTAHEGYLASTTLAANGTVLKIFYSRLTITVNYYNEAKSEIIATKEGLYGATIDAPTVPAKEGFEGKFVSVADGSDAPTVFPAATADYYPVYWATGNTPYKVIAMLQNVYGSSYDSAAELSLTGAAGSTITVAHNNALTGFHYDATKTNGQDSGTIAADGTSIFYVYYSRNIWHYEFVTDGTTLTQSDVYYGAEIPTITAAPHTGQSFNGWYSDATFNTPATVPASMPDNDLTFYGQYVDIEYTLTFNETLTDGTVQTSSANLTYNSTFNYPIMPEVTGYKFVWDNTVTYMPANDLTINGSYDLLSYDVTFNIDGEDPQIQTYKYGDTITPPTAPAKTGKQFSYWADADGNKVTLGTMGAADLDVYAVYAARAYTLSYYLKNENGNIGLACTLATLYGDTLNTAYVEGVPTGYTADGPYTDATFTTLYTGTTMPAKDLSLYYRLTGETVELTFNAGDGIFSDSTNTRTVYASVGSTPAVPDAPTRTGYDFKGWSPAVGTVTGATTYTATWTAQLFTVSYLNADGSTVETFTDVIYGDDIPVTATDPAELSGKTFAGWKTADGNTPEDIGTMPANDLVFTATYTTDTFTITYVSEGTTVEAFANKEYGDTIDVTATVPTKDNYTFVGWYDADGKMPSDYESMPAKDLTFTARFKANEVVVKLVPKDAASTAMVERDGVVETYNTIDENEIPATVTSIVAPFEDTYGDYSSTTYDYWFVTGLKTGMAPADLADYVTVTGGGRYELKNLPVNGLIGTGTIIKVYDAENNLVEQFYVVIYGDLDGNGRITSADATEAESEINDGRTWSKAATLVPYLKKAADLDQNNHYTSADCTAFEQYVVKAVTIDQITGLYRTK